MANLMSRFQGVKLSPTMQLEKCFGVKILLVVSIIFLPYLFQLISATLEEEKGLMDGGHYTNFLRSLIFFIKGGGHYINYLRTWTFFIRCGGHYINFLFTCYISHSYLTGVTKAQQKRKYS